MNSRDFCYWLQGFFEVSKTTEITTEQVQIIKNHLNMVFRHEIDPSFGDKTVQETLHKVHSGQMGSTSIGLSESLIKGFDPRTALNC